MDVPFRSALRDIDPPSWRDGAAAMRGLLQRHHWGLTLPQPAGGGVGRSAGRLSDPARAWRG
ncbi:MAG: hypothetical protein HND48_17235 [Chloroflexi bacterium]|nr:hypothetical protein [Chloroflexota bacterium]